MTVRRLLLALHLYVGLAASLVLLVASTTGAILAFEPDWDQWLHPSLWRASDAVSLPQDSLAALVRHAAGDSVPIRVVDFAGTGRAQKFTLANDREYFVDAGRGSILGDRSVHTRLAELLFDVRRLHVQLLANQPGEWVVDIATTCVLLLVPTGLCLWWRTKRATIRWSGSWWRVTYDLHAVLGIFGSLFVLVLVATGFFIAFEPALHVVTRTKPMLTLNPPHSTVPADAERAARPSMDLVLASANRALPDEVTREVAIPESPRGALRVIKTGRGGVGRSTVFFDAYSGALLRADDFSAASGAERAHAFNQQLHFGTILGFSERVLTALASLTVAALVVTGVMFWARRVRRKGAGSTAA